ncbi:MAG: hypothetical protein HYW49_10465 [Deltaproteobacteria bacterium]|nr:hypothetical protein [Deltaproteobacteria bacterium]
MNTKVEAKTVYLAKSGEIFGPFPETEIEALRAEGSLRRYTWIWSGKWVPLDPAPELDPEKHSAPIADAGFSAVCHDFRNATRGTLEAVSARGCELWNAEEPMPTRFRKNSRLQVNVLNRKTGKAVNVEAVFVGLRRAARGWRYILEWEIFPQMIRE